MESLPQEHPAHEGTSRSTPPPARREGIPRPGLHEAANDTRMSQLVRTIEQEIIPRLMLAHRATPSSLAKDGSGAHRIGIDDVRHFAKLVLAPDEEPAFAAIARHREGGVPIEAICLDLLAPAARYLGELWVEDLCSFTDVTVGVGRLQRVLRELSPAFARVGSPATQGRSVLLLPGPGEQHTFGLVLVGEFFRRAGWNVSGGGWNAGANAASLVAAEWFDAIGFSLGAEVHLSALAEMVRAVKHETCNPDIVVLVGGPLFVSCPAHVSLVGADGMTSDGREAPGLADRLIAENSGNRAFRRAASAE